MKVRGRLQKTGIWSRESGVNYTLTATEVGHGHVLPDNHHDHLLPDIMATIITTLITALITFSMLTTAKTNIVIDLIICGPPQGKYFSDDLG